jgi:hypothetical protein
VSQLRVHRDVQQAVRLLFGIRAIVIFDFVQMIELIAISFGHFGINFKYTFKTVVCRGSV